MPDKCGISEIVASTAVAGSVGEALSWDSAETIGVTAVSAAAAYLVRWLFSYLRRRLGSK